MTHIPTPAEIETLRRKAKHHDLDCTRSASEPYCDCGADEALAILDRLSPPEPEQPDEAEIMWAGAFSRWDTAKRSWGRGNGWQEAISYLRTALSELIASKDAEIAECHENINLKAKFIDETLNDSAGLLERAEKAQSELAALRAENATLRQSLAIQEGISDTVHEALWEADKAAERKPAELADTAPVVEATEVDRKATELILMDAKAADVEPYWSRTLRHVSRIRTEAEARGRREALEIVERHRNLCSEYPWSANHALATAFNRCVGELKRLMTEAK